MAEQQQPPDRIVHSRVRNLEGFYLARVHCGRPAYYLAATLDSSEVTCRACLAARDRIVRQATARAARAAGHSISEIAEELGVTRGSVFSYIRRRRSS